MSVKKSREMAKLAGAVVMVVVMREMSGLIGYSSMRQAYKLAAIGRMPILIGYVYIDHSNWPIMRKTRVMGGQGTRMQDELQRLVDNPIESLEVEIKSSLDL
jgi:hypothetical protein